MNDGQWPAVAELFERALGLPETERARFLATACGDDAALLAQVQALLDAEARPPAVFGATPVQLAAAVAAVQPPAEEGWRVGCYRILRELGRGGMGVVYLAVREDLQHSVALKLIQDGPASRELGARFRREQAVHAKLEHPHIARLLDAGVADDGVPWLAMEFVEGRALDEHCDSRALGLTERLLLFEKVGAAVAYAHRNLVVHRDLKPSNILVTAAGEPKLVDFGIAKPLSGDIGGWGNITRSAGGILTLAYASPEQLRGEAITTATDVYQLGLLLHESLTGLPASDRHGRPLDPAARMTSREPARPSALVELTVPRGDDDRTPLSPRERSGLRRTTPERLRRTLTGDLDTIILKALRPDPAERYASAEQLVEDVRRYREGLPILARPGSLGYRLGKLIRRHRAAAALVATLFVLLIGGVLLLGVQARRVARERDRADQFSVLLEGLIYGADPLGTGDSVTARSVLDRTARQARAGIATEPEVWGRLLVVVGKTYQNMGHLTQAIAAQEDALAALGPSTGNRSLLITEALRSLGGSLVQTGDFSGGVSRIEAAVALARRAGQAGRAQLGGSLADLGAAHHFMGELDTAATLYRAAMTSLAMLPDSGGATFDRLRVDLGNLLLQGNERLDALPLFSDAVARLSAREGPESGSTLHAKTELADALLRRGNLAEAERMAAEVVQVRRRVNREPHHHLAGALLQHARALAETGRMTEAEQRMREALAIWRELGGAESFNVAYGQVQLADILKRADRVGEALELEQGSLAMYQRLSGARSEGALYTAMRLAHSEHLLGRFEAAERRFREGLPLLDSTPSGEARLVRPLTDYAALLVARGRCGEAEPMLQRAGLLAERGWGPVHPVVLTPRRMLGSCLTSHRQFQAAETILLDAYRRARDGGEYAPRLTAEMAAALVDLYERWGRRPLAEPYRAALRLGHGTQ